jgi:hypothetical protein
LRHIMGDFDWKAHKVDLLSFRVAANGKARRRVERLREASLCRT